MCATTLPLSRRTSPRCGSSVGPRLVVSARLQPLRSIDRCARRRKTWLASAARPVALLVHLMHDQGDVLVQYRAQHQRRVDDIEDKLLAGRLETKQANLGALRRAAGAPAAATGARSLPRCFALLKTPPPMDWRATTCRPAPIHRGIQRGTQRHGCACRSASSCLQEEIAGRVAEANNRSLFVLTIVTVLALPINIIAGLLGMNVGGVPLADSPHGFWLVVAIVTVFMVVAGWLAYRQSRK